jgi:hypothetical protein
MTAREQDRGKRRAKCERTSESIHPERTPDENFERHHSRRTKWHAAFWVDADKVRMSPTSGRKSSQKHKRHDPEIVALVDFI